jgi:hypothetical protein
LDIWSRFKHLTIHFVSCLKEETSCLEVKQQTYLLEIILQEVGKKRNKVRGLEKWEKHGANNSKIREDAQARFWDFIPTTHHQNHWRGCP